MLNKRHLAVEGRELLISNADKVYFPDTGFTKGQVLAYYSDVAEVILPHVKDRPLTLIRFPEGVNGEHFYEKNGPSHTPAWVKRFAVPRSEGGAINYILCNDRATLLWATNLGDIEKHVLMARAPDLNQPTSLVFDLDPGEGAGILDCGRVALHLHELLGSLNLQSFVKTSGSKGLHMNVPLNDHLPYEVAQPFAKTVAELAARQLPDKVVSQMPKTLRRGKVLIDWSQNSDFKTTVCVYAMRAKRGAPFVSLPLTWDELAKAVARGDEQRLAFTPAQALKRIQRVGDLFAPVLELVQKLPEAFTTALAAGPPPKLSSWPRNSKGGDKSVREYAAKRDHTRTPEPAAQPAAETPAREGVHRFVIQKHEASHLHYDWRLEMEGVLRSWAVPKGPPTELRQARLAMHVEDHPLEYENFEGTIPPGNYGAGTVMVWDRGEYEDLTGNPAAAFHAGKMHVIMRGTKLKGEWILVKDRRAEDNRWLLIKAGETMPPFSPRVDDRSVLTQRSMRQIAKANDAQWQSNRPAKSAKAAQARARQSKTAG
jgi:bifunctional non-homologous end joining protein LigD